MTRSSRPPVDMAAARATVIRSLAEQLRHPVRARASTDSEHSERKAPVILVAELAPVRTYGDVLADDPILPYFERNGAEPQKHRKSQVVVPAQLETFRASFPEKEQLGTQLSCHRAPAEKAVADHLRELTFDDADEILAECLADDPGAHVFRRAVAVALWRWPRRALALRTCGEAGARCDCADCGAPHVLPYRCGARSCPTCARQASAIACEKIARKAETAALSLMGPWDGVGPVRVKAWRTLVLTTEAPRTVDERYDPDILQAFTSDVRDAWGPFWRLTQWGARKRDVSAAGRPTKRVRRDTLGTMGIEIGDGGMIHLHAAVYGEYIDAAELARLWKQACPVGGFVRVRLMRETKGGAPITSPSSEAFRSALREVLKYLTKGHKTDLGANQLIMRAGRAAAAEYAMRGVRRVETCGALRLVPRVTDADVATEGKACVTCAAVPSAWAWRGIRPPDYVRRNGGFGLSTIADDADAEHQRREKRGSYMAEQQRARERAAAEAHHYRPGGQFYGGTPPPWMDDGDEWTSEPDARELIPRASLDNARQPEYAQDDDS